MGNARAQQGRAMKKALIRKLLRSQPSGVIMRSEMVPDARLKSAFSFAKPLLNPFP